MEARHCIIDLNALLTNFSTLQQKVGTTLIMAVIKANAYGHGLIPIARTLEKAGAHYLGVAFIEEAITLRKAGIALPLLVLSSMIESHIPLFLAHGVDITAASIEKLQLINKYAQQKKVKARVHLKIDTGLGRIGMRYTNAEKLYQEALRLSHITLVGIASHCATADEPDTTYLREQCERFYESTLFFEKHSLPTPLRHIANSGALMQLKESYFDMVRPGIMLYGVYPQSWMKSLCSLQPVLSLYTKVVYFKVLLRNSGISYGLTWKTHKDTRIITLPIGYGDGYPRALSNKGYVLLKGTKYPIVGAVCMDQLMVDIGSDQAYNGDEVVLIGKSGDQEITVNELADYYGGSPYELLVSLNNRIPRTYKHAEALYATCNKVTYEQENMFPLHYPQ